MARFEVDTTCWPLVIQFNPTEAEPADLDHLFAQVERIYRRREKIVWLAAFPQNLKIQPAINKRLAQQMERTRDEQRSLSLGIGFYSTSRMFNFFLSAHLLAWPIDCPFTSSSSFGDLMTWIEARMTEGGLHPPSDMATRARDLVAQHVPVS